MKDKEVILLIPVENQVRELDPKLLLACVAASRGFPSVIGSRREIHFHMPAFPRSVYLSKSMTSASDLMFRIMHKLGHRIVAWDEEALVHLPPQTYYSRRLSHKALAHVSHLFAWGKDNAELWTQYPQMPSHTLIHVTGNPRSDLLRPEMRPFYQEDAEKIRRTYGDFILVNTNFNHVNAFSLVQNLFQPARKPGAAPEFGRAAKGMSREYAEGLREFKQAIFTAFKELIPAMEKAFPDYTIVVRPHPTENHEVYRQIAARCERVRVTNEGNVVPWLMATRALVHNSCTTGVEAFAMGVPAVTYRAAVRERYEFGFYRLPNLLSHHCFDFEELRETLQRILDGELGPADGHECKAIFDQYMAARDGPLASERIVDVLVDMVEGRSPFPEPETGKRLEAWCMSTGRTLIKRFKSHLPGSHNRPSFQRHRYPGLSLEDVRTKVSLFQEIMGEEKPLKVQRVFKKFFQISA